MSDRLSLLNRLQSECWRLFTYVHDHRQYMVDEHWTSHAKLVQEGKMFTDDCDGYACTMAELLLDEGVPASDIHLVYCICENGEAHLVCACTDDNKTYVAENRYRSVYDWEDRRDYQWMYMMDLDDKGVWKKIK